FGGGGRSDPTSAPRTKRPSVPGTARTTPLPDQKALEMILEKLQKKDTYGVFAEPVDPEELPDYHDVIEHPMDFGTVRKKLARNAYRSFEQFEDDKTDDILGTTGIWFITICLEGAQKLAFPCTNITYDKNSFEDFSDLSNGNSIHFVFDGF
ncbi:hypothetical protein ACJX0J_032200, partial [Zea mays]